MITEYIDSNRTKISLIFFFIFSVLLLTNVVDRNLLVGLIILYVFFSVSNFVNQTSKRLPLGEIAALVFFIENCFSLLVLYLNKENLGNKTGDTYYCLTPENDYLIFSFLASQAFLIGYYMVLNVNSNIWRDFVKKKIYEIDSKLLVWIIAVSFLGNIFILLNIKSLFQIVYFFNKLLFCSFVGLIFSSKRINYIYLFISLSILIFTSLRSGMTGELIYFSLYAMLLYLLKTNSDNIQSKFKVYSILFLSFIILILLQNSKVSYRNEVWLGNQEASIQTFSNVLNKEINNYDFWNLKSYSGLIYRLNQGYLVSATMVKVPTQVPFVNGETIFSALKDSLIPRVIDPEKEEAGGRKKMLLFTNLILVGSTSMNIGLLGEAYVNFGRVGAIIFIFIFGLFFAYFEMTFLYYGKKNIMLIVMFPIFFSSLIGSGGDFLMLFNTIVKGTLFVLFVLSIIPRLKK
jgi:hypothetical protein